MPGRGKGSAYLKQGFQDMHPAPVIALRGRYYLLFCSPDLKIGALYLVGKGLFFFPCPLPIPLFPFNVNYLCTKSKL
jgi:hypothetical protein